MVAEDLASWLMAHLDREEQNVRAMANIADSVESPWSPRRLLADIAARRQIVELHRRAWIRPGHEYFNGEHLTKEPMAVCRSCLPEKQFRREWSWPCQTLRAQAVPYAEEEGYLDDWRPRFWYAAAAVEGLAVQLS